MSELVPAFDEILDDAVNAFLQTVVVVDNEASLATDRNLDSLPTATAVRKRNAAPGKTGDEQPTFDNEQPPKPDKQDEEPAAHRLELNQVSQAFAEKGITCGVYLPTEADPADLEKLISATVQAILPTDACVLDWQLRKGDSGPAIEAVKRLTKYDIEAGGRLRLILIYTAERLEIAFNSLGAALQDQGQQIIRTERPKGPLISGPHYRIVFVNKPTLGRRPDEDPAVVAWGGLPQRIIEEFASLSCGLLRAFSLKSVAAVRRDIHRIVAQFDEKLDPVYIGDRATKPDPDDAGRLVVELLQSELALSIEASDAEKSVLGPSSCLAWLAENIDTVFDVEFSIRWEGGRPNDKKVDDSVRRFLIENGPKGIKTNNYHGKITRAFFGENEEEIWTEWSSQYASLTTLAYHTGERAGRHINSIPTLKFGTVIGSGDSAWLCIQPACDTVRIKENTAFLFIKLVLNPQAFDLVIPVRDQFNRFEVASDGKSKHLRELSTLWFKPSQGSDVIAAEKRGTNEFFFIDAEQGEWLWLAQLREMTAVHLAQKAVRAIGRIGLNEFEWLRTSAK